MPAITLKDQLSLRRTVFELCHLRGYTQKEAGLELGLTQPRISQILAESLVDFQARVKARFSNPQTHLVKKLEQYELLRREAWLAWEESKQDSERITEKQQLRAIYEDRVVDGKTIRVKVGEELAVVETTKEFEGRNPLPAYLGAIAKALQDEAKLEGLIQDTVLKITNNNVTGDQNNLTVDWGSLRERPQLQDNVEDMIAKASAPIPASFEEFDVGKKHTVTEQPMGEWSDAEKAELDDEPEHLNGDGQHG